jgi:hypothetical protein
MSRRDGAIVAWHEVPGTAPSQKSRPVGYGLIRAGVGADSGTLRREIPQGLAAPAHTVPYGTVLSRDAIPGTSCQATIGVVPPGHGSRHVATALARAKLARSSSPTRGDGRCSNPFKSHKRWPFQRRSGCGFQPLASSQA